MGKGSHLHIHSDPARPAVLVLHASAATLHHHLKVPARSCGLLARQQTRRGGEEHHHAPNSGAWAICTEAARQCPLVKVGHVHARIVNEMKDLNRNLNVQNLHISILDSKHSHVG